MSKAELLEALDGLMSSNSLYTVLRGEKGTSSEKLAAINAVLGIREKKRK